MTNARSLAVISAFSLVLFAHRVDGQSRAQHRNFEMGVNVAAVSVLTGVAVSQITTIHQRAALLSRRLANKKVFRP